MKQSNLPIRLVSRLDIKGENLIKTIQLEGLRILGNPNEFAVNYFNEGIDEIIQLVKKNNLFARVGYTRRNSHVSRALKDQIDKDVQIAKKILENT